MTGNDKTVEQHAPPWRHEQGRFGKCTMSNNQYLTLQVNARRSA
jgi:hypothetical protein